MELNFDIESDLKTSEKIMQQSDKLHKKLDKLGITIIRYWNYQDEYAMLQDKSLTLEEYIIQEETRKKEGYYNSQIRDKVRIIKEMKSNQITIIENEYQRKLKDIQKECLDNGHKYDNGESALNKSYRMVGTYNVCQICEWEEKEN